MVDPSLLDRIVLPYDRLLARGSVVRGRVTAVSGERVYRPGATQLRCAESPAQSREREFHDNPRCRMTPFEYVSVLL